MTEYDNMSKEDMDRLFEETKARLDNKLSETAEFFRKMGYQDKILSDRKELLAMLIIQIAKVSPLYAIAALSDTDEEMQSCINIIFLYGFKEGYDSCIADRILTEASK